MACSVRCQGLRQAVREEIALLQQMGEERRAAKDIEM